MAVIKGPMAVIQARKQKPTQADLECHRSLDAFCSWIEQFAEVNTGHFVSEGRLQTLLGRRLTTLGSEATWGSTSESHSIRSN